MFKALLRLAAFCLLLARPTLAHGSFVYVTNYADGTVSQFRAASNGSLTPLDPPAVRAWPRCHSLAADPSGRYLYVLSALDFSRRNCLISQYRIGTDGRLTPLFPLHVPLYRTPYLIMVHPKKPFLYVLNYGGAISGFRIRKGGTLALYNSPVGVVGNLGYSAASDRPHSNFYISGQTRMTNEYLGGITGFHADDSGDLHQIALSLPNNGSLSISKYAPYPPQQVIESQAKHTIYVLYQGFAADGLKAVLAQYRTQCSGGLHPMKPRLVISPGTPQESAIDPRGRYCYVFVLLQYRDGYHVTTNKIILVRYKIGSSGTLGQSRPQTFTAPGGLFSPVFDPSGRTLYLLTPKGISLFHVRPDGSALPVPSRNVRTGNGPTGMVYVQS